MSIHKRGYGPSELSGMWWAMELANHPNAVPYVKWFYVESDRDEWCRKNPLTRAAVGKRHPTVKAFRAEQERLWRASRESGVAP